MTARRSARWALLTLGAATIAPAPLRAQDVAPFAPAQQESLQRAIRFWLGRASASDGVGDVVRKAEPAGDHYRVELSIAGLLGNSAYSEVEGGDTAFDARPDGSAAWLFDSFDMKPVSAAVRASPKVKLGLQADGVQWHIRMDPAMASPSTIDNRVASSKARVEVADATRLDISTGPVAVRETWQPVEGGRTDRAQHATAEQVDIASEAGQGKRSVHATAGLLTLDARLLAVSQDALARLNAHMGELSQQMQADAGKAGGGADTGKQAGTRQDAPPAPPPPAADTAPGAPTPSEQAPPAQAADISPPSAKPNPKERAALREMVAGIGDAAHGFDATFVLDDVAVSVDRQSGAIRRLEFSEGVQAVPDGMVEAHLRMAVDGLELPGLPPAFRAYVPGRFVLAPRVTGVAAEPLRRLLEATLVGDKPDPTAIDAAWRDLQGAGPVEARMDELALTVGPAALHGTGTVRTSGHVPTTASGTADIEATGFDALIRQLSTDPLLKQAAPILIFLKGIGDQQADGRLRWHVAFDGRHATVNGTDLSQLIPR